MRVLLFGGTSEGSELARWLAGRGCPVDLCVATEYGHILAPNHPGIAVHTGRLDEKGMEELMARTEAGCVVDATHPYAALVTENIRGAAGVLGLPCLRLIRRSGEPGEGVIWARDMDHAARLLEELPGNVLLTTGSKELAPFARPGLAERCFPRILPAVDGLARCLELGFPPAHIICMQGPFSRALNEALIGQFAIKTLVTKDGGDRGGFGDKANAARATGCALLVVERPSRETGLELEEMKQVLEGMLG